jgi:YD repeat-containing protein
VSRYPSGHANAGRIAEVSGGSEVATYIYDASQQLVTVTVPDRATATPTDTVTWTHTYAASPSGGHLTQLQRTVGAITTTVASWTYDGDRRVSRADEPALPEPVRFAYTPLSGSTEQTTVSDDASVAFATYTHRDGRLLGTSGTGAPGIGLPFASAAGDFSPGEGYARLRERTWHPRLLRPLVTRQTSVLNSAGFRETIDDYDDPATSGDTETPSEAPTDLLRRRILEGSTLDARGNQVEFANSDITTYSYDASGRLTAIAGPRAAQRTEIDYQETTGFRSAVRRYLDGEESSFLEWTFEDFDAQGNPETVTDPNDPRPARGGSI